MRLAISNIAIVYTCRKENWGVESRNIGEKMKNLRFLEGKMKNLGIVNEIINQ